MQEVTLLETVREEQDAKLKETAVGLNRKIQSVANAPVQINLSDDAKRDIVRGVEARVAAIEAKLQ